MIELYINNKRFDISAQSSCTIIKRLSAIDELELSLVLSQEVNFDLQNDLLYRRSLEIKEDDGVLFSGFVDRVVISRLRNSINIKASSKLSLLQQSKVTDSFNFADYDLIDFLNKNAAGIKFEAYNITPEQRKFTQQINNDNYYRVLNTVAQRLNIEFWYDYYKDVCLVGIPNKELTFTDSDVENGLIQLPETILYSKTDMVNRVDVQGGSNSQLGIELASGEVQTELGYSVKSKLDSFSGNTIYYVEDVSSIERYGLIERTLAAVDVQNQSVGANGLQEVSNALFRIAVNTLTRYKDPLAVIDKFEVYVPKNNLNQFGVDQIVNLDLQRVASGLNARVKGKFQVADVSVTFKDFDSTEAFYSCSLASFLPKETQANNFLQEVISKFNLQGRKDDQQILSLSVPIYPPVNASVQFSIDSSFTSISSYQLALKLNKNSTQNLINVKQILLDGFDITDAFDEQINVVGTSTPRRIPAIGYINILSLFPNSTDKEIITENLSGVTHTLEFKGISGSETGTIETFIIIKGNK